MVEARSMPETVVHGQLNSTSQCRGTTPVARLGDVLVGAASRTDIVRLLLSVGVSKSNDQVIFFLVLSTTPLHNSRESQSISVTQHFVESFVADVI